MTALHEAKTNIPGRSSQKSTVPGCEGRRNAACVSLGMISLLGLSIVRRATACARTAEFESEVGAPPFDCGATCEHCGWSEFACCMSSVAI